MMMDKRIRITFLLIKAGLIWWNICLVISDQTVCSEYLVSGLYGVDDSALTASSIWPGGSHYSGPQRSRLHFDGNFYTTYVSASWVAAFTNDEQYIQVQFPRKTKVEAVLLQGRGDPCCTQWVKTYYVLYSIDGITWTTVTSQNQQPRLFTGNTDRNTVVKSSIEPSITAVYLRINPRTFNEYVSLRFDVSGCYIIEGTKYHRLPMMPSPGFEQHVAFETQSNSLPKCSQQCHKDIACTAFSLDVNQRICRGFNSVSIDLIRNRFSAGFTSFFIKEGILTSLGYRRILNRTHLYKVNEIKMNQTGSGDVCKQQHSQLKKVDSESVMLSLQNIIVGNTILMHNHSQLFVSGMYVSLQWKYSDGDQVNSALWSPGNPDPSQGHCVMLTQTGLSSVDCTQSLFSICGMMYNYESAMWPIFR